MEFGIVKAMYKPNDGLHKLCWNHFGWWKLSSFTSVKRQQFYDALDKGEE